MAVRLAVGTGAGAGSARPERPPEGRAPMFVVKRATKADLLSDNI